MLPRQLEPEVMDTPAEASDYDAMDHSAVNRLFVDEFVEVINKQWPLANRHQVVSDDSPAALNILDVGTGTAQIPLELCHRGLPCLVTAIDLAEEMLKLARHNVAAANCQQHIHLQRVDAKHMPYDSGTFDAVMSNSIIHHIPSPIDALGEMFRVLKPGGVLFVRDLLRPATIETLDQLVATYAGAENAHQQQMFRDSLHAALTVEEVQEMLVSLGHSARYVSQTTDRHWTLRMPG